MAYQASVKPSSMLPLSPRKAAALRRKGLRRLNHRKPAMPPSRAAASGIMLPA